MKTIKSLKDITTLEVDDKVVFGDLKYIVTKSAYNRKYYLLANKEINNDKIFRILDINKRDFVERLGIDADTTGDFPETKSLEALTAVVSALFKEYEQQNALPKTWEEFCKNTPIQKGECLIGVLSEILETQSPKSNRDPDEDKNYYISKQEAQAFRAFMQLRQLRKAYIKDWKPDWTEEHCRKYNIVVDGKYITIFEAVCCQRALSFPTAKLAEQFLTNFKDLLEIAKPLL